MKRLLFVSILMPLLANPAVAAEIEDVHFVEAYRVDDVRLKLNNLGLMRYKGIIKAMVAGLYLQDDVSPEHLLEDVAKRLEIEYFWSLKANDIVKASNQLLSENVDDLTLRKLRPRIDLFARSRHDSDFKRQAQGCDSRRRFRRRVFLHLVRQEANGRVVKAAASQHTPLAGSR